MTTTDIDYDNIKGEVSGAFLLGLVESFQNLSLLPLGEGVSIHLSQVNPLQWYPQNLLINVLQGIQEAHPSEDILFQAGVNFLRIWYEQGPGKTMINSGLDWLYANNDSGGYNSVVRGGNRDEIGWCLLQSIDEEAGIAVYENVMPLSPDFVKGVFYGGCVLFDDMEWVEVDSVSEPYASNPSFYRIIITVKFRLKPKDSCLDLDERISNLQLGSTLTLKPAEIESLIWRYKGLQYRSELNQRYSDSVNAVLTNAVSSVRISATAFETQEGMVITDINANILQANQAFMRITGYSSQEVIGQNLRILSSGRQTKDFYTKMWNTLNNTGLWEGEIWNRRKNGEVYPQFLTISTVKNFGGTVTNYVGTFTDITQRKKLEDEVRQLAFYDALTKLPNRRLLIDRLSQMMAASKRSNTYGALMFLDLDNFKPLNDVHGHEVGDMLLIEAANRLTSCIREMDTVARFGGDEFVVVLNELDKDKAISIEQATIVAEKIREALSQPYVFNVYHSGQADTTVEHRCTGSIGILVFNGSEGSQEDMMKWADTAMYEAKDAGRNQIRFYGEKG
jgi:diguanylate cyclase (GGDEF)-like protein/PAS domain S-box-containing protein